jgi:hypothetical protein
MFAYNTAYPQSQNLQGQFLNPSYLNNQCALTPSYLPQPYVSQQYLPQVVPNFTPVNMSTTQSVLPQNLCTNLPLPMYSSYVQTPPGFWQPPFVPQNYHMVRLPYFQQNIAPLNYQPQPNIYSSLPQHYLPVLQPIQDVYPMTQPQLPTPIPLQASELPLPFASIRPGYLPTPAFTYQPLSTPGGVIH